MSVIDGLLVLLAVAGIAMIFIHGMIFDMKIPFMGISPRELWEKWDFTKELLKCSLCCAVWFSAYGILCVHLSLIQSFWFYVLTLPFACSAFSYMFERTCILVDEKINQLIKK